MRRAILISLFSILFMLLFSSEAFASLVKDAGGISREMSIITTSITTTGQNQVIAK
ncbi:MAG: hypothetical protein HQM16_17655, partial [Deltaproteobacteria bacterium]|nr:hypothetical protein [Deltaproteobacteria bacterium]